MEDLKQDLKLLNTHTLIVWQEIDPEDWQSIAKSLIDLFFQSGQIQYEDLNQKWLRNDIDGIVKAAHCLKSSCGNIGAETAHALLNEIERSAKDIDKQTLDLKMQELASIYLEVKNQLKDFYAAKLC